MKERTRIQFGNLLRIIEKLMEKDPSPGSEEGRLLGMLAEVASKFEDRYIKSIK
jgi:hypothetical protein